jgi:stage V sporulation protein AD
MHHIIFRNAPVLRSFAAIGGQTEGEGHFGKYFDRIETDPYFGKKTWEQAESALQRETFRLAVNKALLMPSELDCILAGDLIDQCTASSFAHRRTGVPFLGLYGACSTMAEALLLGGILTDGGYCERVCAVTSSHFPTAERQFRFPLSYGGQRTPTAQRTCTASGAAVIAARGEGVTLAGGCIGCICDLGVTDATNMGAAMAPAAADTIARYLHGTGSVPEDYDAVITGDLGCVGTPLLRELLTGQGIVLGDRHHDCGAEMFDNDRQDTHAGGSGAGCAASVLCAYWLPKLAAGKLRRILFCATGALLSAVSAQQGESIPGICHLVEIRAHERRI